MVGRKSLFKAHMIEEGEKLAALGLTLEEIAWVWGRNVRSLYRWSNAHPEFSQALKRGKLIADMNVTQSLYKRATGYEYIEKHYKHILIKDKDGNNEDIKFLEKEVVKQIPPDPTSIIFWEQNRRPDLWKDRRFHEHSGLVTHFMTMKDFRESKEKYDKEREGDLDFSIN